MHDTTSPIVLKGTYSQREVYLKNHPSLELVDGEEAVSAAYQAFQERETSPLWKMIFTEGFVHLPLVDVWIPKGSMPFDRSLGGVLIVRDYVGNELDRETDLSVIASWKKTPEYGALVSPDGKFKFLEEGSYFIKEKTSFKSLEENPFVVAHVGRNGAELLAKTARDARLTPWIWGFEKDDLTKPREGITALGEYNKRLHLGANGFVNREGYAFVKEIASRKV